MVNRVHLVEESTTLAAPKSFRKAAKWRLLSSTEDIEEPESVDSTFRDPLEARDKRSKGIYDGNKDEDNDQV